ncbi:MAG: hypothetical protein ACI4V1_09580, partial [Eubacteriales bacterium]
NLVVDSINEAVREVNDKLGINIKKVIVNVPDYNAIFKQVSGSVDIRSENNIITNLKFLCFDIVFFHEISYNIRKGKRNLQASKRRISFLLLSIRKNPHFMNKTACKNAKKRTTFHRAGPESGSLFSWLLLFFIFRFRGIQNERKSFFRHDTGRTSGGLCP